MAEGTARFGECTDEIRLVDPLNGTPLVVNKWGRMAKSFESVDAQLMVDVLTSAKSLITLLADSLGLELFITGGTLLGLVRDGKLIANDDDADLAYVSKHENPSDIVLESYEVERVLAEHGLETVRHSSGHLQVMFGGTEFTDGYYVDIFTYFVTEGWFYGTFHAREKAADVTILPLGSMTAGELELPIPANTDQMLNAIYGPTWRTPDPAFTFVTPEAAGRRFYWWLNHFDPYREDWEDYHRGMLAQPSDPGPSALATWLEANLPPESTVLELGCGLGADALVLVSAGHSVVACDYSRPAIAKASVLAGGLPDGTRTRAKFLVGNVNSIRHMATVVKETAILAGPDAPVNVMSRNLFDNLHYLGRDNALQTISHLLARGGLAYLQMRNPKSRTMAHDAREPVGEKIFDPWDFSSRLPFYGLEIVQSNFLNEPGSAGASLSYIVRKVSNK